MKLQSLQGHMDKKTADSSVIAPFPFSLIRLIVGIGNPGSEYANTYHNVGVGAVEFLARFGHVRFKNNTLFSYGRINKHIIAYSRVFMNESGKAVSAALRFTKITPQQLLLIHDDSDIALGKAKFSFGRGAAGHRGADSVIRQLGTKDFWRLRVGIRTHKGKAGRFVLAPVSQHDQGVLESVFEGFATNLIEKEN